MATKELRPKNLAPKEELIELTYLKGRQSIECIKIWKVSDVKFKVHIKVDSYRFQSYGRGHIWDPQKLEWKFVYSLPYQVLTSYDKTSYIAPEPAENHSWAFSADLRTIISQMYKILL